MILLPFTDADAKQAMIAKKSELVITQQYWCTRNIQCLRIVLALINTVKVDVTFFEKGINYQEPTRRNWLKGSNWLRHFFEALILPSDNSVQFDFINLSVIQFELTTSYSKSLYLQDNLRHKI